MPPSSTPWTATQVFTGVPENGGVLCAPYKIPAQNTRYREFSTELDTNGVQVSTVARTEADAVKLADALRGALAGCGSLLEQQNPGLQAVSASHGKLPVEEGAWVYSLDTADPQIGISDIHLFSVGRDSHAVHPRPLGPDGQPRGRPAGRLPHHDEDRRQQAPTDPAAPPGADHTWTSGAATTRARRCRAHLLRRRRRGGEGLRWWHRVGVNGSGRWVPGHGVGCGQVRCHEVTKRLPGGSVSAGRTTADSWSEADRPSPKRSAALRG
ncbi:hypothetical protein SMICM17S_05783 [Streptomyces microflavus]